LHVWEFVNSPSGTREHWRWRRKDPRQALLLESTAFTLFLNCLADARVHGFDLAAHEFSVVKEAA
jgi:hypothetical protein